MAELNTDISKKERTMPFSVHLRDRRGPEKMEIRMASLVTEAELLDSGATRVAFNDHLP